MIKILGIGGTVAKDSSTERALAIALEGARSAGAQTEIFGMKDLVTLPHYGSCRIEDAGRATALIASVRAADGLIIASPGYHGSISGLLKNALDYLEETARDNRPYLDDLPVGLIATAYGPQASASTLAALRAVTHALRGWPTPLGACVISRQGLFTADGCSDPPTAAQITNVGRQTAQFALRSRQAAGHCVAT